MSRESREEIEKRIARKIKSDKQRARRKAIKDGIRVPKRNPKTVERNKEIKKAKEEIVPVKTQREKKIIQYQKGEISQELIKISDENFLKRVDSVDNKLITLINSDVVDILEQEEYVNQFGNIQTKMSLKDLKTLTKEQRVCISKVKYLKDGGVEVVFFDKLKAIDMFYKRIGAYRVNRSSVDGSSEANDKGVNLNVIGENIQVVACTGDNGRGVKSNRVVDVDCEVVGEDKGGL